MHALVRAMGSRCRFLRLDINLHFFENGFGKKKKKEKTVSLPP